MAPTLSTLNRESALALLSSLASWRTLALILAIINLKNLPFVWHFRLLRHFVLNIRWRPNAPFFPKSTRKGTKRTTHPVFTPYAITSHTPLLETDYNLHKSNSTYFSDLDVSRTALVTRLYSPGISLVSKALDAEFAETAQQGNVNGNDKGNSVAGKSIYIVLGSVYCSFKREIKPFERYVVESRVLGWDQKWMYILSFFLRPADAKRGGKRTLFATAVSKYVVKKGRLTVPPERVLRMSGFLPERTGGGGGGESLGPAESGDDASGTGTPAGITATASAAGVDGSLVREVLRLRDGDLPEERVLEAERKGNEGSWDAEEWGWERIEEERMRGLKVLEGFCDLDAKLFEEWE